MTLKTTPKGELTRAEPTLEDVFLTLAEGR